MPHHRQPNGDCESEDESKRREIHKAYATLIVMEIGAVLSQHLLREVSFFAKQRQMKKDRRSQSSDGEEAFGHDGCEGDTPSAHRIEELRERIFGTILDFSSPLGILADWFRLNPSILYGAVDIKPKIVEAKNADSKNGKAKDKKKAIHGDFGDITFLASQGRRRVLDAMAALANRLNDNASYLIGKPAHEEKSEKEDKDLAGAVAEAALDDEDTHMRVEEMVALPEEQEFRGFSPLQGSYDKMWLPGSVPGKVFLGEMPTPDADQHPVPPLSETEAFERRCSKILRLVKHLSEDPNCVLQRNSSTGRYMTQPKIELLKPTGSPNLASSEIEQGTNVATTRYGRTASDNGMYLEKDVDAMGEEDSTNEECLWGRRSTSASSSDLHLPNDLQANSLTTVENEGKTFEEFNESSAYSNNGLHNGLNYGLPLSGYIQQDLNAPSVMFNNTMGLLGSQNGEAGIFPSEAMVDTTYSGNASSEHSGHSGGFPSTQWAHAPAHGYFASFYEEG